MKFTLAEQLYLKGYYPIRRGEQFGLFHIVPWIRSTRKDPLEVTVKNIKKKFNLDCSVNDLKTIRHVYRIATFQGNNRHHKAGLDYCGVTARNRGVHGTNGTDNYEASFPLRLPPAYAYKYTL